MLFDAPRRMLLLVFEAALVATFALVAGCLRNGSVHAGLTYPHVAKKVLVFTALVGLALTYSGFYELRVMRATRTLFVRVFGAFVLAGGGLAVVSFAWPVLELGRGVFLVTAASSVLLLPTWRYVYNTSAGRAGLLRRTIVLGNGGLARELAHLLEQRSEALGLALVGTLVRERPGAESLGDRVLGTYGDLLTVVEREAIECVIVAFQERRGTMPVQDLLEIKFRGIEIVEGTDLYERETGKLFVRELKPSQLIFSEGFVARSGARLAKRAFDVIVASIGLVLAAPLALVATLAVRLDSAGPVLYRQVRAGEGGRPFVLYKFRSMRSDAERDGAQFAKEGDERVTRVGRFIRKTRIDELPQLWNVLRGDMSMVGPRPERPVFLEELEARIPYFKQRLQVKPGVTGHAQVRCPYGASVEDMVEKLQHDLYYIKRQSLLFDLSVILETIKVVVFRIGAR